MGDHCYLKMRFVESDLPAFQEILGDHFWSDREESGGVVTIRQDEADHSWYNQREDLAATGVVFVGHPRRRRQLRRLRLRGVRRAPL